MPFPRWRAALITKTAADTCVCGSFMHRQYNSTPATHAVAIPPMHEFAPQAKTKKEAFLLP